MLLPEFILFFFVTPNFAQTVTKVTVCNLVGPPELSHQKNRINSDE